MDEIQSQHNSDSDNDLIPASDQKEDAEQPALENSDEFNWPAFAVAASFALLIVSLSLIFYSFNLKSTISEKEERVSRQETQITDLKASLRKKEEMLSFLRARELEMIMLSGLDINPDGYGKVFWNPGKGRALLQISNLPPAPGGKIYKLWLFKGNKPVKAGTFSLKNRGENFFLIENMPDIRPQEAQNFAVSLEAAQGLPTLNGDIYLMSKKQ